MIPVPGGMFTLLVLMVNRQRNMLIPVPLTQAVYLPLLPDVTLPL